MYDKDIRVNRPDFSCDDINTLYEAKYLNLYDIRYREDAHYLEASRRKKGELVALKDSDEFRGMLPDAVTIAVVVRIAGGEPRLLLNYEYRYPSGQFLLSPIAGLIDPQDCETEEPLKRAAIREIYEESGLKFKDTDTIRVINPCAFSSPGMTDESNAFLYAEISIDNESELSQEGAEGSELFGGYELVDRKEARKLFSTGRDRYGNFYSLSTWVVLAYFLMSGK